jgi:exodeoxyribonuclease V alpha subunit
LHDADCLAAERLARLLAQDASLFKPRRWSRLSGRRRKTMRSCWRPTSDGPSISGGPEVGKTTSVQILVELLERRGVPYVLLSPTGKAAKRLSEVTQRDAYRIHRQLFSLDRQRQQLESQSPAPVELFLPGDAVIVDEASMVDVPLLAWLLRCVGPQTRLTFVGEQDQLASVGPGSVLHDLIASGRIPVTLLTVIKRQGEGSPIVEAAHAINHGQLPVARSNAHAAAGG